MASIEIPQTLLPRDGRFGSGPSRVRDEQLDALNTAGRALIGTSHRAAPVKQLVADLQQHLTELYDLPDGYEVVLGLGGASVFWDTAAAGLIDQRSQHVVIGEFSAKFARAASAPWLQAPDLREAAFGEATENLPTPGIDLYAWPHNETSTGVQLPVRRVDAMGALSVVDGTSAAGGAFVDPAQFDVYYFSPQKNLGSEGGLWIALMSPAAIERAARIADGDRFIPAALSLQGAITNSRKHQTINTPAIATLFLLDQQVQWLLANGGLAWADARTKQSSQLVYDWAEADERLTPFVSDPTVRSQVVTTIDLDERIHAADVTAALRENGIVDVNGYRKLGRNQLRIGTFVAVEPAEVQRLIESITYVLDRM
ncbi:phosphoserine transaminase [Pseudoclavibacter sp. 13-3]|uniref:phosphoserine transaminase n=1 Tax=Pseudoclavibacter sp. 13-3 TaxID=2901228 RepID=UPI001E412B8E|nr:phosphoserine transaminase [Pseudoclavibacter sp. 13-3]MCD7101782.1 phosphoserine transaminase [Pseudoclavibacter sp. 13-3]